MENLQDKVDELQFQTGVFADLCEFVWLTHDHLTAEHPSYRKVLSPVIRTIRDEAARIDEASDAIFNDKRMIEFYYSLNNSKGSAVNE